MQFIIPTIFTATNRLSGTVKVMQTDLVGFAAVGAASGVRIEKSFKAISASAYEVATATAMMGAAILLPLALATKAAIDFEKQMGNVATLVDTAKESMSDMGDQVLKIASRTPVAIHDLTEALYQIRSAGIGAGKAMTVLDASAKLAVAGLGTTVDAANMITSTMNVFKKEALDANAISDILFKTVAGGKTKVALLAPEFGKAALAASDVGISFKELMAMTAAVTNTGVQTAEAQNGITSAMVALNKRTSEMVDIQEKLAGRVGITGMEFIQFAGSGVAAMKMVDDFVGKNRLDIFKTYGRREGALMDIALTRNQNGEYNKLMQTMGGAATEQTAYQKQLATAAAQAMLAKNNMQILSITIGTVLVPVINSLVKAVTPAIKHFSDWVHNHKTLSKVLFVSVGIVGVLITGISVLSFTVGAVTKAIALWGIASKAAAFAQGILAAATGTLNGELILTSAAGKGARAGLFLMESSLLPIVATLATAISLLGIFTGQWNKFNDTRAGLEMNYANMNFQKVKESLERRYIKNPQEAQQFLIDNPKYNAPSLQKSFRNIDAGIDNNDESDDALHEQQVKKMSASLQSQMSKMMGQLGDNGYENTQQPRIYMDTTVNVSKDGSAEVKLTARNQYGVPVIIDSTKGSR